MKPVLFLDFDRALFDTDRLYAWLGEDYFSKILAIVAGKMDAPDFATFLYPDTVAFLKKMRAKYRLAIITYSVNTKFTRMKLRGTNVALLVDDIIITQRNKSIEIREYLARIGDPGWEHTFVDDAPLNIDDVKRHDPEIRVVRIDRVPLAQGIMHEGFLEPDEVVKGLAELEQLL